jgi:hypothetical protein
VTAPLLEGYERSIEGSRFRFSWSYYRGAKMPKPMMADAWFTYFWRAGAERECSHCGQKLSKTNQCWVSGETGFVLCLACPLDPDIEFVQSGTFLASFTPAESVQRSLSESATLRRTLPDGGTLAP